MSLGKTFFYNLAKYYHNNRKIFLQKSADRNFFDYKKILVISTTAIGDTLLSTPVFAALRQEFPHAIIKVLAQKKFLPLFSSNPHVDGFIPFQKGVFSFFKIVRSLRVDQFQIALVLHVSDPFPIYMATFAKIPFVAGYSPDKQTSRFFSHSVQPPAGKHVIYTRLAVLEALKPQHRAWSQQLVLPLPEVSSNEIHRRFKKYGLPDPDKMTLVGFQPGASKEFKMWPIESFIKLGKKLIRADKKIVIVILGSQAEKQRCKKIVQGIFQKNRAVSLCGLISLSDLPVIVSSLQCLVTNDTGTMHIAIALQVPTVSLFVPTSHKGIGPIQDNEIHRVVSRPRPCGAQCTTKKCTETPSCMSLLPVDEVLEATLLSIKT